MTPHSTNAPRRSVRHRGTSALALALATLAGVVGVLAMPDAASAASLTIDTQPGTLFPGQVTISGTKDLASTVEIPSLTGGDAHCIEPPQGAPQREDWSCTFPLPDGEWTVRVLEYPDADPGSPVEADVDIRVLGAPAVTGPVVTSGLITGTGHPGSGIVLSGDASGECGAVQSNGSWACPLSLPSGTYSIAFTQTWERDPAQAGATSDPVQVTVDKDPPPLPVITAPAPGSRAASQPTAFAGTGQDGNRVNVYVDGTLVCGAPVTGSQWTCSAALADGEHAIQAIQWDAVGNASGATDAFTITAGAAAAAPPRPPGRPAEPPAPPPAPSPTPTPTPTPTPVPEPSTPFFPPPVGGDSGLPPGDTWGTPTDYGAAIPDPASTATAGTWLLGLAVAAGFVLLVALPLRLLATTLRARRRRSPELRREPAGEPLLSPPAVAALTLGAAVLLAALAGGIQAEVRYLRLALAIAVALAVLNGVGVALATKIAGRAMGVRVGIRLAPVFLVVAALTALVSRGGGIQPPVIVGVLLAASIVSEGTAGARGILALAQLGTITLLGLGAWLGQGAIGTADGFGPLLASESLASLCLAALGSAVVLLLPVWRMPGRLLFEWSPLAWGALGLVAGTLAAVVIASSPSFPLPWVAGIALVFAAVSVATWSWMRFVDPQLPQRT